MHAVAILIENWPPIRLSLSAPAWPHARNHCLPAAAPGTGYGKRSADLRRMRPDPMRNGCHRYPHWSSMQMG